MQYIMRILYSLRQRIIHFVEAIAAKIYVDVVCNVYVCVSKYFRQNFDVNVLVVAVCSKSMSENMLSHVFHAGIIAQTLSMIA